MTPALGRLSHTRLSLLGAVVLALGAVYIGRPTTAEEIAAKVAAPGIQPVPARDT
jgi:hypothetical protein